jgi:phosphoenolpyruvate carboxylase
MTKIADLNTRLQELHALTAESPLYNPVFQLSLDLSRKIESGDLALEAVGTLVSELECDALQSRAAKLHGLVAPVALHENDAAVGQLAAGSDFEAFAARWLHPLQHIVFTAHPTFLLNGAQSDAVAHAASKGEISEQLVCAADHARDDVTLDYEHDEALAAIGRASAARDHLMGQLFAVAAQRWPDKWRSLRPLPYRFATWVGYDMDGRTDIGWTTSLHYRLPKPWLRCSAILLTIRQSCPPLPTG